LYWFSRLLRAEVSPSGTVTCTTESWLELLAQRASELKLEVKARELRACEHVVRAVLDYACDLVQNAVDIVSAHLDAVTSPDRPPRPQSTWGWRRTFDEELDVIARQRRERLGAPDPDTAVLTPNRGAAANGSRPDANAGAMQTAAAAPQASVPADGSQADGQSEGGRPRPDGPGHVGWSRRIRTGEHEAELVGLAISGGGIRSATFALGVLQRLQELDVLRQVDYLSTVSGGRLGVGQRFRQQNAGAGGTLGSHAGEPRFGPPVPRASWTRT